MTEARVRFGGFPGARLPPAPYDDEVIRGIPRGAFVAAAVAVASLRCGQAGTVASDAGITDAAAERTTASDTGSTSDGGDASPPVVCTLDAGAPPADTDVPTIPVGLDAYRHWDRWPYLHIGERAYTRSTFDRSGGNEGADAAHFLRLTNDRAVVVDVAGAGVLYFTRANHWHGSPWHEIVDGHDVTVTETSTATPTTPSTDASFLPPQDFPPPLALTWPTTQGSDVSGVPVPFTRSLEIDDERTHYGTGYFNLHLFPACAGNLSQPLATWTEAPPAQDVVDLLASAGQDIASGSVGDAGVGSTGTVSLSPGHTTPVLLESGAQVLRALSFTVPSSDAAALGAATLTFTWDGAATPSISAPLSLFFGAGTTLNREGREYLVKAFPVSIHESGGTVTFAVYFPMPFQSSALVSLVGGPTAVASVAWSATLTPFADPASWVGELHATYVDQGTPVPGQDFVMLDTTQTEGGGDWCGQIVGTSFTFSDRANLSTLEGDPRFFFDDSQTPQVQGTGTEEWGGGGDYWQGGQQTTLPLFGHPVGAPNPASMTSPEDGIESAYRFLLADAMPFGKNARVQLEHGGTDDSTEHYRTLVYWYGHRGACLAQTDALHVGDATDEAAHHVDAPGASAVDTVTSRYEWGVDARPASDGGTVEVYPASTDTGRHTTGAFEMTLAVRPDNLGVMLRRKLDQSYPDQRAEVYVGDANAPGAPLVHAATWYTAGSNTVVYSNPPGELSPFTPTVETSNRRWRDDELLLPRAVTQGKSALRVRIVPVATALPLTPAMPAAATAWSAFRYSAYVWTLPPG